MGYPVSNFTPKLLRYGVTCNDRIALIVVLKWSSFTGSSLNMIKYLFFFYFYGKDGEDRTRDLTAVHNLTSCLRRHSEEVD